MTAYTTLSIVSRVKIVIMGDTNADIFYPTAYPGKELLNSLALAGTRPPFLMTPTSITCKSATCIIAINDDIAVKSYTVIPLATSDYYPVTALIVSTLTDELKPIIKRLFNKVDFEALGKRVEEIDQSNDLHSSPDILLNQW